MNILQVTNMLVERLEYIPADSIWAHRASGLRGSLLKIIENLETHEGVDLQELEMVLTQGFRILEEAAKERLGITLTNMEK